MLTWCCYVYPQVSVPFIQGYLIFSVNPIGLGRGRITSASSSMNLFIVRIILISTTILILNLLLRYSERYLELYLFTFYRDVKVTKLSVNCVMQFRLGQLRGKF